MSAMYYLNRGGAPEGPFDEARLVYMIQSGELTQGGVCPVGQQQWLPLHAVQAFAQALTARFAQPAYGAAQPAYGAAQPGTPAGAQGAKKNGKLVLFAVLAGVFVLVLGGCALAAYLMFFSSGGARSIAKSLPRDSEFLIQVPSVHQLVSDLHDVQYLDTSLRDDKQVFDSASDSVAKAFDISQTDAAALLASSETFGISGRKLASSPEVVLALGMKNASPVETLLKSSRFVASGAVGKSGKRYQLTRKLLPSSPGQDALLKGLAEAELGANAKEVLVWFADAKLLAIGSAPLVGDLAQVLEAGAPSFDQNPSFQAAAKDFDTSARLTAFVDPGVFATIADPKLKEVIDGYFKPAGPLTGSLQVKPAGFLSSFVGHVTGSKLPQASAYEAPQALNLGERLPEETFSYIALSTQTKLTGAQAEKLLLDQLSSLEPRSRVEVEQGLRQMEQLLGVSVSKLIDGAGGQSVIALAAAPGLSVDALNLGPQALASFNLTWLLELKDVTEYEKLAAGLKHKILPSLREAALSEDGAGFALAPRGLPLPVSLHVKFLGKYLFVTVGANALCARAEAAFSKAERTLKDDPAHQGALATLPSTQHFLMWVDAGRLSDALNKNALFRAQMSQSGLALDKIKLTGPDRVVSALSVRSEVQNEVWTYRLDALNFHALAPLGAGGALLGSSLGRSSLRLPAL